MEAALVIAIVQAILKFGPSAVLTISDAMSGADDLTPQDIQALFIDKEPAEYFKD
jgi:hypothetical protein